MRRLAVFASGSGTNFEAIATACERGEIPARVVLMVCDKPGAGVVQRAAGHGVEAFVFAPKEYASKADYEREIVLAAACEPIRDPCGQREGLDPARAFHGQHGFAAQDRKSVV